MKMMIRKIWVIIVVVLSMVCLYSCQLIQYVYQEQDWNPNFKFNNMTNNQEVDVRLYMNVDVFSRKVFSNVSVIFQNNDDVRSFQVYNHFHLTSYDFSVSLDKTGIYSIIIRGVLSNGIIYDSDPLRVNVMGVVAFYSPYVNNDYVLDNSSYFTTSNQVMINGYAYPYNTFPAIIYDQIYVCMNGVTNIAMGKTYWSNVFIIPEGTNSIEYFAVSNMVKVSTSHKFTIIRDDHGPQLTILGTSNNQTVYPSFALYGDSTDLTSLVQINISVDGQNYSPCDISNNTAWFTNLSLNEGSHNIKVYGIDALNNYGPTNEINIYVSKTLYVSALQGNDLYDGLTKDHPVKTIQLAVNRTIENNIGRIYLEQGVYTPGNGLNNTSATNGIVIKGENYCITGGWNSDYSLVTGYSEVNAADQYRPVWVYAANIRLENMKITRGRPKDITNMLVADRYLYGGGLFFYYSIDCEISNLIIVSNNYTPFGSGVFIYNCANIVLRDSTIRYNYNSGLFNILIEGSTFSITNCVTN